MDASFSDLAVNIAAYIDVLPKQVVQLSPARAMSAVDVTVDFAVVPTYNDSLSPGKTTSILANLTNLSSSNQALPSTNGFPTTYITSVYFGPPRMYPISFKFLSNLSDSSGYGVS